MFACLIWLQVHRVTIKASHSRYLWCPGRVFNLCRSFVLDLNHSNQWNTLLFKKVKYSSRQIWWLHWGIDICISWSDLPQFFNSCPNSGSFSNSLQSDLLSDSVNLGLKLPDLFRSKSFWPFMLCFYTKSISLYPDLVFLWLDLSFSLCFGIL